MAVGGEQLIAGQYTCTWNGASVGIFEGDEGCPSILSRALAKPVENTDRYGYARIDSVHLGYKYWFEGVLIEWPKAVPVFSPFGAWGNQGIVGMLKYQYAKPLVLTVVQNGTTAVGNPNSVTMPKAIIAEDSEAKGHFGPVLRVVSIKMDIYPSVINQDGSLSNWSIT